MKLKTIYDPLKNELKIIEEALLNTIDAKHPILEKSSIQLLKAGGKRIRPVFVLLSSQFGNIEENKEQIYAAAVALELIHMATLVHDDVVDDAKIRRGLPTIKHTYDNRIAMYSGDYILARALEVISTISKVDVHRELSDTLVKVVEGEVNQIEDQYNLNQSLRNYLQRIKRKTALLIATSCKLGALASDAPQEHVRQLYKYGYYVGMSFQIIDDILDITSSPEQLGKPTGSDLLQGNITLPVLCAMEDETFKQQLQSVFRNEEELKPDDIEEILVTIVNSDAIEKSYSLSNLYLQKANEALNKLPKNKAKKTLQMIANIIGKRKF
jgi:heptaprenyl diphosphate synthase